MPGGRKSRRRQVGAILIVLGLVAAAMAVMPAAVGDTVSVEVQYNGGNLGEPYFDVTVGGGTYPGYCVDLDHGISSGTYTVNVYDPNDPAGPDNVDFWGNMDRAAWLMNQGFLGTPATGADGTNLGTYNSCDIQVALWSLVDANGSPDDHCSGESAIRVARLVELAMDPANEGFTPACGQLTSLVLEPTGDEQVLIIFGVPKTCSGQITVEKVSGEQVMDFPFAASWDTDGFSLKGGGAEGPVTLDVGAGLPVWVEELVPAGWSLDSFVCLDAAGAPVGAASADPDHPSRWELTLTEDADVTCTYTDSPHSGQITVEKVSGEQVMDFPFAASWDTDGFSLKGGGAEGPVTLDVGAGLPVWVEELVPAGWSLDSFVCLDAAGAPVGAASADPDHPSRWELTLTEDADVTCTYTDSRDLGRIRIVKELIDPLGLWDDDGSPSFTFVSNWAGDLSLPAGSPPDWVYQVDLPTTEGAAPYSVSEATPPASWLPVGATCASDIPAHNPVSPAAITLEQGELVTCTFTNERAATGRLTITKDATPDDGTQFSFGGSFTSPGGQTAQLEPIGLRDPAAPSITLPQGPGAYVVTEGALPTGWVFDDVACTGAAVWEHDGPELRVSVGRDEAVVCTFRNSGRGEVIVHKTTDDDDAPGASFGFHPQWGPDFTLVPGGSRSSGPLPAGIYSVVEVEPLPAGWSLAESSCSDGSPVTAIDLGAGETVTCTFTNEYQAPEALLTIVKQALPLTQPDDTAFPFSGDLGSFQLTGGESQSFGVDPGKPLSITEALSDGWELSKVDCRGVESSAASATGVTVTVAADGEGECTFYNVQTDSSGPEASLTIVKMTAPAGGGGFSFDAGSLGAFTLDDGGRKAFTGLAAGDYTVTEAAAPGWELTGVNCDVPDFTAAGHSVTVSLAQGEQATCVFANGQVPGNTTRPVGLTDEALPYTGSPFWTFPLLMCGLSAVLMGLVMVAWPAKRRVRRWI